MENLKKCPFCGSKAKIIENNDWGTIQICCSNEFETCYILPCTEELYHLHEAEYEWNKRAYEAELRANVIDEFAEKVKEILKSSKEAYENMAFTYAMGGSNNKHMKYIYEGKIDEIRSIEQCVEKIASQMKRG